MSTRILNTLGFFFLLVLLLAVTGYKSHSGFRGGEGIGGRTAGPAASLLSPADVEGFRGGQAINGRTAGPSSTMLSPGELIREGFTDLQVTGAQEIEVDLSPANAELTKPRKPYHLLSDVLQDAPRDTVGNLRAACCAETDFEARTNLTGNYLQRTNNYKRSYPDNCTGPLHDFTMAFYKTEKL